MTHYRNDDLVERNRLLETTEARNDSGGARDTSWLTMIAALKTLLRRPVSKLPIPGYDPSAAP